MLVPVELAADVQIRLSLTDELPADVTAGDNFARLFFHDSTPGLWQGRMPVPGTRIFTPANHTRSNFALR